jgi:AP endonuclease-1
LRWGAIVSRLQSNVEVCDAMGPKRKADSASDDEDVPKAKKAAKKAKAPLTPLNPDQPINRTFPPSLSFPAKPEGHLRLATWNICGIKSCDKKGLKFYLEAEDADIVVLTETKCTEDPKVAYIDSRYKYRYWEGDAARKGYGWPQSLPCQRLVFV